MRCADTRVSQLVPISERWMLFCMMTCPMYFALKGGVDVLREIDLMRS